MVAPPSRLVSHNRGAVRGSGTNRARGRTNDTVKWAVKRACADTLDDGIVVVEVGPEE
jgi:hypothetical protein